MTDINPADIRVEAYPTLGVQITHVPTRISKICASSRSQYVNQRLALVRLEKALRLYSGEL